eukprot:409736-Prorocentrum_minimum.AAC.2
MAQKSIAKPTPPERRLGVDTGGLEGDDLIISLAGAVVTIDGIKGFKVRTARNIPQRDQRERLKRGYSAARPTRASRLRIYRRAVPIPRRRFREHTPSRVRVRDARGESESRGEYGVQRGSRGGPEG